MVYRYRYKYRHEGQLVFLGELSNPFVEVVLIESGDVIGSLGGIIGH
jgi:hypothetical protein